MTPRTSELVFPTGLLLELTRRYTEPHRHYHGLPHIAWMLDQARDILNLPEPKEYVMFPSAATDDQGQRQALASYQVRVTNEFLADAARACKKRQVPASVRAHACKESRKVPAALRVPVVPDMPALEARNDQVGNVITPWWDAVCALAPKPKNGDVPACVME